MIHEGRERYIYVFRIQTRSWVPRWTLRGVIIILLFHDCFLCCFTDVAQTAKPGDTKA